MRKGLLTIVLLAGLVSLAACGGSSKSPATGSGVTSGTPATTVPATASTPTTTGSGGGYSYGG